MNQNSSVRKLVHCGVVAAIYVVLCLALQPLSYGAVQVRVAEALCLLPVFGAEYIVGVVLGCFLANLLGSTIVDVIFGTLATLLACLVAVDGLGSNGIAPKDLFHINSKADWCADWLDFMDMISEGIAMPLGAMLMSIMVGWEPITSGMGNTPKAWFTVALAVTILMLLFQLFTLFGVRERKDMFRREEEKTTLRGMWEVLTKNDQLLWTTLAMSLFNIGYMSTTTMAIYYMQYVYLSLIHISEPTRPY